MGNPVLDALRAAIETKRKELAELEKAVAKYEAELTSPDGKPKRFRRSPGFKQDSIPYHVHAILTAATKPLTAADISDALKAKGKDVDSRLISASIARYIDKKIFRRDEEGKYLLVR